MRVFLFFFCVVGLAMIYRGCHKEEFRQACMNDCHIRGHDGGAMGVFNCMCSGVPLKIDRQIHKP